jgi:hypothetical protein
MILQIQYYSQNWPKNVNKDIPNHEESYNFKTLLQILKCKDVSLESVSAHGKLFNGARELLIKYKTKSLHLPPNNKYLETKDNK